MSRVKLTRTTHIAISRVLYAWPVLATRRRPPPAPTGQLVSVTKVSQGQMVAHAQRVTRARTKLVLGARRVRNAHCIHTLQLRLQRALIARAIWATRTSAQTGTGHASRALGTPTRPSLAMGRVWTVRDIRRPQMARMTWATAFVMPGIRVARRETTLARHVLLVITKTLLVVVTAWGAR